MEEREINLNVMPIKNLSVNVSLYGKQFSFREQIKQAWVRAVVSVAQYIFIS